jgi:hypothetical protein
MSNARPAPFAGPAMMIISAVVFGFFGYFAGINWNTPGLDGDPLLFRQLLGWTLRIATWTFLACGLITFVQPLIGNALYAVAGLISAVLFVVVAIMDIQDQRHGVMAYGPIILIAFALFNGYGSWQGIRAVIAASAGGREAVAPQQMT